MRELRYSDYYASYDELKYNTSGNNALQLEPVKKSVKKKKTKLKIVEPQKRKPKKDLYTKAQVIQNRMMLLFTIVALSAVCFSCINYLQLQAKVSEKADNIAKLEAKYVELKTDNDLAEVVINSTIDYNYISDVAINELGMVYAGQDQVIVYDSKKMECVKQLDNIPVN